MTDDICGYEGTTTGEPCQHPAGSCPVPTHSVSDAENPQGSPLTFTDGDAHTALKAAREGKSESGIEREVGVGEDTIFGDGGWMEQDLTFTDENGNDRDFSRALRRARSDGESEWIDEGRGDDGDSSFAKFMLATSYGYKKTDKHEHDIDADVTHELTDGWSFVDDE